jgi:hypothetical protein
VDLEPRTPVRPIVLAIIVSVVAAGVFAPAISGGWLWDDHSLIANNPFVHSLRWWNRWMVTDFWDVNEEIVRFGHRMVYWRPLVTTSYGIEWQLGGGSPLLFHVMNLLWHAVVGVLAFVVLRRWIGVALPALAAALLFVVHPTKAESVAWIAGRTDVLCMVAMFVASQGIARRLRSQRFGLPLEIIGTIAAYMCKEQAIVLPVFAAVEGWVFAGRPALDLASARKIAWTAAPQFAVTVVYLAARAILLPIQADATSSQPLPFGDHVLAVLDTFGRFFELTFVPHDLSVQQGLVHTSDGQLLHSMPHVIVGAVGLAVMAGAAVAARRRLPVVTLGIGLYVVTLLPTSNIRSTEMVTLISERFLYLPVLGLAWVVGALLARADRTWARRAGIVVAVAFVATSVLSFRRAQDYADDERFWARELRLHPDSNEARDFALGKAIERKQYRAALALLLEIKTASDTYGRSYVHEMDHVIQLATLVGRLTPDHDVADLRAIDRFCAQLLEPTSTLAELHVGDVAMSLSTRPGSDPKGIFRARLLALRAELQGRLGDDRAAIGYAQQARAICSRCMTVVVIDAISHGRAGDFDRAFATLDEVASLVQEKPVSDARAALEKARRAQTTAKIAQGPARLQAEASQFAALELWGRAYEVLAPYKEEIKKAPNVVLGFAELAFRAGETAVAREVLSVALPASEAEEKLEGWGRKMGWGN